MLKSSEVLKTYRAVLRHLNRLPTAKDPQSLYRQRLRDQFRAAAGTSDDAQRLRLARSYVEMVTSVREAAHLRSLDSGEKLSQEEIIKATAARVGFALPEEYSGALGSSGAGRRDDVSDSRGSDNNWSST